MPSLTALVDLLSLDVVAALVQAGYRAPWRPGVSMLPVVAATNTTPIVVTLDTSSLGERGLMLQAGAPLHLVFADVGGNDAVNKQDPADLRNEAWHARVLDASRVELYDLDESTGQAFPSVGNGGYTSGGTCSRAFTSGRILCGEEHIYEQADAPRAVMVPRRSKFQARSVTNPRTIASVTEQQRQELARSIRTEVVSFEVHVWGALIAAADDPAIGFDYAREIYHQIIRSAHLRCAGVVTPESGQWVDQAENATQIAKRGREFVFEIGIQTPVPDRALTYAPTNVAPEIPTSMTLPDTSSGEGCP